MATKNKNTDALTELVLEEKQEKAEVLQQASINMQQAEAQRRSLLKIYKEEKTVPVYLSPMYRPYFGNVMQVMVNGISIFFKVDGSTQMVPQTFADEIAARRMAVDEILTKQKRMSDVTSNSEASPGELELF